MEMLKRLFLLWLNFFLTRYKYLNKILAKHPFFSGTLRICQNTGIILYDISNNILSIIKVAAAVAQWVECSPRKRRFGLRIPVATDLCRKNR